MSLNAFFAILALAHGILFVCAYRGGSGRADRLVQILLLALLYDNVILALGNTAISEEWYYSASWFRYMAHVVVLPLLVLAALDVSARAGIEWAKSRSIVLVGFLLTMTGCVMGFVTEIAGLELVVESLGQHTRLVSAHASPPLATIVSNFAILALAALIWRRAQWPWLFAAALFIFIVNGSLAGNEWGIVAGNLAEVVFALAWVTTLRRFAADPIDNSHLPAA